MARAQVWPRVCPHCGQTYRYTNFMRRRIDHYGEVTTSQMDTVRFTDTHLLGCQRRAASPAGREEGEE